MTDMKARMINLFEALLIGTVVLLNGLLIQTPLPDGWDSVLLDRYSQCLSDVAFLDRLIERNPKSWQAYLSRAQAYALTSHWQQVIDDCTTVTGLNSANPVSYRLRGSAYFHLDQNDRALADLNHVIEKDQGLASDYALRALVRCRIGQFQDALNDARQAAALDRKSGLAFYALAVSQYRNGLLDDAFNNAKISCLLDPYPPMPYVVMAMVLKDKGNLKRADHMCEIALQHDSTCGAAYWQSAEIKLRSGKFDQASNACMAALSLSDSDDLRSNIYFTRAQAYMETGRLTEALEDCDKAIALRTNGGSPDYDAVKQQILQRLR